MKKRKKKSRQVKKQSSQLASGSKLIEDEPQSSAKSQILFWIGIVGGALTIFSNFQTILDLAHWARFICESWSKYTEAFWRGLSELVGLRFHKEVTAPLNFLVAMISITLGALSLEGPSSVNKYPDSKFLLLAMRCEELTRGILTAVVAVFLMIFLIDRFVFGKAVIDTLELLPGSVLLFPVIALFALPLVWKLNGITEIGWLLASGILFGLLYALLSYPIAVDGLQGGRDKVETARYVLLLTSAQILPFKIAAYTSIAKPKFLVWRLLLVATMLMLLIALNFLSLSGFSLKPPGQ